jgi:hypothetical protein
MAAPKSVNGAITSITLFIKETIMNVKRLEDTVLLGGGGFENMER